ncbi:integrase [Candidatus Scalindua japonica]|uniref:Integrase n=1 Tax=Candidatus Scalindua japonica TaxID=1284222 RepID=A0A286U4K3_9BACT|nr:hypothetical protein [Candidatus Scalindua japonica]GAX63066.1 integrase [Candidatus Scalindua japonica]
MKEEVAKQLQRCLYLHISYYLFNILFLYRHSIDIEVKGLEKTVRAKRGLKFPVVLTVKEVDMSGVVISAETLFKLQ